MIVDDEPSIRKGLVHFIPWSSLDCEVVAIAVDGFDAVDKLNASQPDIIITDIKMPEMDGLELSKYIYQTHSSIKIILLTAYNDFFYSQQAIKYGVVDFVLKPTSTEKLVDAVNKAKSLLIKEQENTVKIKSLEKELLSQLQEMQEHYILKIINQIEIDPKKINEKCQALHIELVNYYGIVIQLPDETNQHHSLIEKESHTYIIKNLASTILKDYQHYTVVLNNNYACIFINFDNKEDTAILKSITSICNEIVYIVKNLKELDIFVGISNVHTKPSSIANAYHEALEALANKFYIDKNIFIYTTISKHHTSLDSSIINGYCEEMKILLEKGKYQESVHLLDKIFEIQKITKQSIESTKNISILIYALITGLASRYKDHSINTFEDKKSICALIWQSNSIDDIYNVLVNLLKTTFLDVNYEQYGTESVIEKVDRFIYGHYQENIQLHSIAQSVHLNSSYLSRLYKKETNMTLTERITNVRMEKAKTLLATTQLKVYEIASLVGVENSTYFSILFKKYTKLYPKEYRNSVSSNIYS